MKTELKQRIIGGVVLVVIMMVLLPFFLRGKQPTNTATGGNTATAPGVSFSNNGQKINLTLPTNAKDTDQAGNSNGDATQVAMNQPNLAVPNANEYSADDSQARHGRSSSHQAMQEDEGLAASAIPLPNDKAEANDADNNNLQSTLQTELKDNSLPDDANNAMINTSINTDSSTVDAAVNTMPAAHEITKSVATTRTPQIVAPVKSTLEAALTKAAVSSALSSRPTTQAVTSAKPPATTQLAAAQTATLGTREASLPPKNNTAAPAATMTAPASYSAANVASWQVQVASFAQAQHAETLINQLHASGLSAYSQQGYLPNGGQIVRVFIGPLSLASALQVKQQLQSQFHIDGLIKRGNS